MTPIKKLLASYNRTIEELKLICPTTGANDISGYNRTIEELKRKVKKAAWKDDEL